MTLRLVLLRHGQSQWNLENRFTGWVDVGLSPRGIEEARSAGQVLNENGYQFDIAVTSLLKRSIHTLWIALEELDQMWIPVYKDWRLNERHYGGLQGLNKIEMTKLHGEKQVLKWRRGYAVRPPALEPNVNINYRTDPRYEKLESVPLTESLADTYVRVVEYWEQSIAPLLLAGQRILISAHGNSLRALVKYLDNISDEEITSLNIPTGIPLVYELDGELNAVRHFYLANDEQLKSAVSEVKNQVSSNG